MTDRPGASASASSSASVSVGAPVEYKVVDQKMAPSDPATAEALLTDMGQQGWRLSAVYSDPIREMTRWIFSR